ncbi:MAG: helix-turn-helix transcriptional regulator [Phototrophicaceae bacterium]
MNLGKAIKLCRTQRGLSQAKLAQAAEISISYLSLLERGKRDPTMSTIEALSNALNVPISILVFLAANDEEMKDLGSELREKLSYIALRLIESSDD